MKLADDFSFSLLVRVGGDIIFFGGSRVRRNELEGEHLGS